MRAGRCALLWSLALFSCATAQVQLTADEAAKVERALSQESRYLRISLFVTPFFADATRRLLTPVPPEHVRLLADPQGAPINPGPAEAIFPAGTPVRISKVELPTAFAMAERMLYTPRTLPWVFLDVGGTPRRAPPHILVLPPGLKGDRELLAEVDRYLTPHDPRATLEAFSDAVQEAVRTKTALPDMPAESLEMSWGYPDRRVIELEGQNRKETWTWADGSRVAVVVNGRVSELR